MLKEFSRKTQMFAKYSKMFRTCSQSAQEMITERSADVQQIVLIMFKRYLQNAQKC